MTSQSQPVDPVKLSQTNDLVHQLSSLLAELLTAARATAVPTELIQIGNEMLATQTLLNTAVQAQAAADDAIFLQSTESLKTQAGMLSDMETQVKAIVSDAASAGRIVGYIAQAIAVIEGL